MKRTALALITVILFSATIVTQLVNSAKANPMMSVWIRTNDVAPDYSTKPPTVSILSPDNNKIYGSDTVALSLNVSIGDSRTASGCVLDQVYYEADWQPNNTILYSSGPQETAIISSDTIETYVYVRGTQRTVFSETINLTGIPEGTHTIMVHAVESGRYLSDRTRTYLDGNTLVFAQYYSLFKITGSSFVRFTVDATPPVVSFLSIENKTYYSTEIQLNCVLNEKPSRMVYSLDGQENMTIVGNATLTNLPYGEHNLTVFATDEVSNTGASETILFTVEEPPEPFPTVPVATASIASVAFLGVGLIYFKKNRR